MKQLLARIYRGITQTKAKSHTQNYGEKTLRAISSDKTIEIGEAHYANNGEARAQMYQENQIEEKPLINEELIKRQPLKNTPFEAVNKGTGWFIGMSPFILTKEFPTIKQAEKYLEENKWNIIINLMTSLIHYDKEVTNKP